MDGGGCAGFQYVFDLAEAVEADDAIAERDGVRLVVDPMSLDLVRGGAVDFVESLGGAAFRVEQSQRGFRLRLRLQLLGLTFSR